MERTARGLPPILARRPNAVLRPQDAADVYAHPRPELRRLDRAGLLRHLGTGYYVRVPQGRVGDDGWRPDLHATALGIAEADYGIDAVALMHLSAARRLGALPRELAVAVVAVPKQRPVKELLGGRVVFVKRQVEALDLQRTVTEIGQGWQTSPEQTALDLAHRPALVDVGDEVIYEALRGLGRQLDWGIVDELAADQRLRAAADRVKQVVDRA